MAVTGRVNVCVYFNELFSVLSPLLVLYNTIFIIVLSMIIHKQSHRPMYSLVEDE